MLYWGPKFDIQGHCEIGCLFILKKDQNEFKYCCWTPAIKNECQKVHLTYIHNFHPQITLPGGTSPTDGNTLLDKFCPTFEGNINMVFIIFALANIIETFMINPSQLFCIEYGWPWVKISLWWYKIWMSMGLWRNPNIMYSWLFWKYIHIIQPVFNIIFCIF